MQGSRAALVIVIASAGALALAYLAQYGFGLAPCVLCLYQRVPYAVAILLGLAALPSGAARLRPLLLGLAALAFAVDAGIAFFHVGVEWHWWAGTAECSGTGALPTDVKDLFKGPPPARCDEPAWSLFGLTMAGYNVIACVLLAIFAALAARRSMAR